MKPQKTTARPSVDLDATDEFPVFDAAAYEAEALSREAAEPSGGQAAATESAPPTAGADAMLAVEHWIVRKTEELAALHQTVSHAQRERSAAVSRADALSRELAETKANLEALNGRERTLAETLTREQEAAQLRAAELDAVRGEATRLAQDLADTRAAATRQNAALADSGALLEQRSGQLQALQRTHQALIADRDRAARDLSELKTRLRDSEAREHNAQRTIEAQNHAHGELTHRARHDSSTRERLAADVKALQAQLANCLETLQSRESYRTIYESALQDLDAELAAERSDGERKRGALESRLAELTAEQGDTHARLHKMEAALTATRHRAEAEAFARGTAAERLSELESAMTSRQTELTDARHEIERYHGLLEDLAAALVRTQTLFSDQSRLLEEREAAASTMAASQVERTALITSLRGQIDDLTARLATPEAERRALEEHVAGLTKEAAESDARLTRLESMNSDLRATVGQLNTALAERDAELQRSTQIASMNAYALGRVQSSIDELGRTLTSSQGAPTQAQTSILTRIDNGQNHSLVLRGRTTIGRDRDNDLSLAMRSVSRHHAVLIPAFRTAFVQDLSSTNGVLVNQRRVRYARLEHGDVVAFGEAQFRYTVTPAPAGTVSTGSQIAACR